MPRHSHDSGLPPADAASPLGPTLGTNVLDSPTAACIGARATRAAHGGAGACGSTAGGGGAADWVTTEGLDVAAPGIAALGIAAPGIATPGIATPGIATSTTGAHATATAGLIKSRSTSGWSYQPWGVGISSHADCLLELSKEWEVDPAVCKQCGSPLCQVKSVWSARICFFLVCGSKHPPLQG